MADPAEFLLEIGFEEMPAAWLPALTAQLRERFLEAAERERLEPAEVLALSTPRRLVLRAHVRRKQDDREESVWGPALKAAKDAAGQWTGAAQGFARKNGVAPEALGVGAKEAGKPDEKSLLFVKKVEGRESGAVLASLLPALLRGLAFPKRMSWDAWLDDGKGAFPFGRPIRWLVALLGGAVVPFAIHELVAGWRGPVIVESGQTTFGHRFLPRGAAGGPLRVTGFADLEAQLRKAYVILRPDERRATIARALEKAGTVEDDHGLVAEWQDLVEHPAIVLGEVPAEFRSLPREVLETVLVHHQKYVPLLEAGTVARFAALTNTDGQASSAIARNMGRVVVARLRDASFFWRDDRKRPLESRVADLAGVTFHQGLGTYLDKANRLEALVRGLGQATLSGPALEAASAAARLCKADLTTAMVREFPELQGVMGGLTLEAQGDLAPEVAAAVRWHYHPLSIDAEAAPAGKLDAAAMPVFAAVSLADKVDTLAGYFGLGLQPTGSSDPFGLRRAGQGVIRVLLDFWPAGTAPRLESVLALAIDGHGVARKEAPDKVAVALRDFLLDRLQYVLEARGFPAEEVAAVVHTPGIDALGDVRDCFARLEALHKGREQAREDFEHLAGAFKRAKNILTKDAGAASIEPRLFEHDAERELHAALERLTANDGAYDARIKALASLRQPVNRFFEDVLVMAE
ncbi:MAG TPA: glycine--tRNA ligase subunit beta, partial [Vicinamibacteria bacterium]|nr:glycine--tRNA ligase subunit beta [Vicinamibacteria bacterium]